MTGRRYIVRRNRAGHEIERQGPFDAGSERYRFALAHQLAIAAAHNEMQPRVGPSPSWQLVFEEEGLQDA